MIKITEFNGKKGKYFFGSVKVGKRGQIVIPQKAREIFQINAKDKVYIYGHLKKGLALTKEENIDHTHGDKDENHFEFGSATVGERFQIVIPMEAREVFNINPEDLVLVFGDIKKGLGFIKASKLKSFATKLFEAFGGLESFKDQKEEDGDD
ncbi:MAG: AbrB/MazE/SpoVT family DNA-binding domain-containing protein [Promethearchaeota archaeon]